MSDFTIIRTNRRKSVSIKIVAGEVQIVVPKRLSKIKINEIIQRKASWIENKLQMQSAITLIPAKEYIDGECFIYLGKNYRLKLTDDVAAEVKLKNGFLVLGTGGLRTNTRLKTWVKQQLVVWYKLHAEQRLLEKTFYFSALLGVHPKTIVVKNYKARWGSCSINGDISYNWKIIMAPDYIVDYLVIHELCHMKQHNHSPAFWTCVASLCPDYRDSRQWLKENGNTLDF